MREQLPSPTPNHESQQTPFPESPGTTLMKTLGAHRRNNDLGEVLLV